MKIFTFTRDEEGRFIEGIFEVAFRASTIGGPVNEDKIIGICRTVDANGVEERTSN